MKTVKRIGLFFGTFNPIHIGHLIIANHIAEYGDLDQVWFVITPLSPFKNKASLLENHHRLRMVEEATEAYDKLLASDIEFSLPEPNYTVHTLAYLSDKYPSDRFAFSLIMGEDNLKGFHKWKNYTHILAHYRLLVYPRYSDGQVPEELEGHPSIVRVAAPRMEISSTQIRAAIAASKNVRPLLPLEVYNYIDRMNFYRN